MSKVAARATLRTPFSAPCRTCLARAEAPAPAPEAAAAAKEHEDDDDDDDDDDDAPAEQATVELKVGPIKGITRIGVKVGEYREEKGAGHWPHSKFVTDILRASYICETAKALVTAYEGLQSSPDFEVVRLKNKIGSCAPSTSTSMCSHPEECEDPSCARALYLKPCRATAPPAPAYEPARDERGAV